MNKNDKKIFELKKKLENRKLELGDKPKITYKTNCVFNLFGQNYNIHAMNSVELKLIFKMLQMIDEPKLELNGFAIADYLEDISNEMIKINYNLKALEIKRLETGLDELISTEGKTSIEIEKIAKLIG